MLVSDFWSSSKNKYKFNDENRTRINSGNAC
jgi:hypothetical protein